MNLASAHPADSRWASPITDESILAELPSFDFIDVGSNKGDSFNLAIQSLGGTKGLALDINPRAVNRLREAGIPALLADCRKLNLPAANFSFAIMSHVLEHLDSRREVALVLSGLASTVKDFLYVRQPFFDEDAYLSTLGLKSVGSNLSYHPLHLSSSDYVDIFRTLELSDFAIYGSHRLLTSLDSAKIINSTATLDTKGWKQDPSTRPKAISFQRPIYRELVIVIRLSEKQSAIDAASVVPQRHLLFKGSRLFGPLPD